MKIFIAASGTGGHLFPALFVAKALKKLAPDCDIQFIGSGRPLEAEIIDKNGFKRHVINITGVKRLGIKGLAQFVLSLPQALRQTLKLFSTEKPDVVFGAGGYVSVLPVIVAFFKGVPSWIHEAELKPGLANYVLSYFAKRISTAFRETQIPCSKKVVFTGHPVREELVAISQTKKAPDMPRRLLVVGGSQGARAIDLALEELSAFLASKNLEVWHQSRPENVVLLQDNYARVELKARVMPFIADMVEAFNWADLVISRSGAGSVMELSVVNIPAILVPYPFAQGGHQKANALTLVDAHKALLVEEGENFGEQLREALSYILKPENYKQMKDGVYSDRKPDGALEIAKGLIALT